MPGMAYLSGRHSSDQEERKGSRRTGDRIGHQLIGGEMKLSERTFQERMMSIAEWGFCMQSPSWAFYCTAGVSGRREIGVVVWGWVQR